METLPIPNVTDEDRKVIALLAVGCANLPLVMVNPIRLRQVMYNLIGNAIKYTPNNGQVLVKAFQREKEVQIEVSDTGFGIPAADQPHIFEKFYRVRDDHVVSIKGTGLGLAITKSIVEKHQGRIWLHSNLGKGSTFFVALPLYNPAGLDNENMDPSFSS